MIKSRTMSIGLIVGSIIMSSHARAQPHVTSGSNVWTPPGLEFNVCMQRGEAAMRQAGSTDVQQQTLFAGLGYIVGNIGDYHATIMCITYKGVVVFNVAGLDNLTAQNLVSQLNKSMVR